MDTIMDRNYTEVIVWKFSQGNYVYNIIHKTPNIWDTRWMEIISA